MLPIIISPVKFIEVQHIASVINGIEIRPRLINLADIVHIGIDDVKGQYTTMIYLRNGSAFNVTDSHSNLVKRLTSSNALVPNFKDEAAP